MELTVEGSEFRFKTRFNKFTNLPELMNLFKEVADIQTRDMVDLDTPELRDGKYIIVESEHGKLNKVVENAKIALKCKMGTQINEQDNI